MFGRWLWNHERPGREVSGPTRWKQRYAQVLSIQSCSLKIYTTFVFKLANLKKAWIILYGHYINTYPNSFTPFLNVREPDLSKSLPWRFFLLSLWSALCYISPLHTRIYRYIDIEKLNITQLNIINSRCCLENGLYVNP